MFHLPTHSLYKLLLPSLTKLVQKQRITTSLHLTLSNAKRKQKKRSFHPQSMNSVTMNQVPLFFFFIKYMIRSLQISPSYLNIVLITFSLPVHLHPTVCSSFSSDPNSSTLLIPMKAQEIPSAAAATSLPSLPSSSYSSSPNKLPFHRNITLTVSLQVGSPSQNVTMVLDTGSELSWLYCGNSSSNHTQQLGNRTSFDPTSSTSYSNISCSSPTCTTRTRDFSIPVSCDADDLCHTTLSYADMSSAEGILATDVFRVGASDPSGYPTAFGCMFSGFSSNPDEDSRNTGIMGMNRGNLSFVSQMGLRKFSYCISGSDPTGLLLLGEANVTWLAPLNYTPLIQISDPLPYFNRVAYTVRFEGIKVAGEVLPVPKSILEPDHTGAGQTIVDSGTQFSYLLGPVYEALRTEFMNQTRDTLRVLDDPNFVFEGGMDLCYRVPINETMALPELPPVSLVFHGAEMRVSGEPLLYRVPGEVRGDDAVYCFTFGNSDLLGVEAYVIGHHHQQNLWMEFDLLNSRIGLAEVQCSLAVQRLGLDV